MSLLALASIAGCDQSRANAGEPPAAEPGGSPENEGMSPAVPSPGPQTAPAPSAAAQSSFKEESFTLTLEAPDEVTAGSEAEFKVTLLAQGGYKINEEYPIKFQFEGVKGYLPKQAIVKKADGQVDKTTAVLPLVLTVEKAGKVDVGGKLSFSVCTDERCLIEKRDLTLSVDAS